MSHATGHGACVPAEGSPHRGRQGTFHEAMMGLQEYRLGPEQVRRVAVARSGEIHIEAHQEDQQRFLVYDSGRLREIYPQDDLKIPFISKMNRPGSTSPHRIVSYRPGRRVVIETESCGQDTMIKAYRKRNTLKAKEKYAIALSAAGRGGFDIPDLLDVDLAGEYMLMEKRAGRTLTISPATTHTWRDVGAFLRQFQGGSTIDGLNEFTPADELTVLDERARRFCLCLPELPEGWVRGRERLEDQVASLPPPTYGLAHRDLHDRQLIVGSHTISLLDFDLLCIADVALDSANLLAHMKLRIMQAAKPGTSALRACREGFLQGLDRQDETGFEYRQRFYEASTFLRLALLYALRPRWSHLTPGLISEGQSRLNDLETLRAGL